VPVPVEVVQVRPEVPMEELVHEQNHVFLIVTLISWLTGKTPPCGFATGSWRTDDRFGLIADPVGDPGHPMMTDSSLAPLSLIHDLALGSCLGISIFLAMTSGCWAAGLSVALVSSFRCRIAQMAVKVLAR
jgi:hypothetical protein